MLPSLCKYDFVHIHIHTCMYNGNILLFSKYCIYKHDYMNRCKSIPISGVFCTPVKKDKFIYKLLSAHIYKQYYKIIIFLFF